MLAPHRVLGALGVRIDEVGQDRLRVGPQRCAGSAEVGVPDDQLLTTVGPRFGHASRVLVDLDDERLQRFLVGGLSLGSGSNLLEQVAIDAS